MKTTLDRVPNNISVKVEKINITSFDNRLSEFGLNVGEEIQIVRSSSCGSPKILLIKGCKYAVRIEDLKEIVVSYQE